MRAEPVEALGVPFDGLRAHMGLIIRMYLREIVYLRMAI
jgi:hypothetical protein